MITQSHNMQKLVAFYENLTPSSLDQVGAVYALNATFTDPFNSVRGVEAIRRIFEHMFATVHQPVFKVDQALSDGQNGFLTWTFSFQTGKPRARRQWVVQGATHVQFNHQGQVSMHYDYWDPAQALYEKTPLLGGVFRWLRRRLSSSTQ